MKDTRTMTPKQINTQLDELDKERSALTDEFISCGRGYETSFETARKTDPLAVKFNKNTDNHNLLRNEIERRFGPNAPSRCPDNCKRSHID